MVGRHCTGISLLGKLLDWDHKFSLISFFLSGIELFSQTSQPNWGITRIISSSLKRKRNELIFKMTRNEGYFVKIYHYIPHILSINQDSVKCCQIVDK